MGKRKEAMTRPFVSVRRLGWFRYWVVFTEPDSLRESIYIRYGRRRAIQFARVMSPRDSVIYVEGERL